MNTIRFGALGIFAVLVACGACRSAVMKCSVITERTSGPTQYIERCEGRPQCRNLSNGRFVPCPEVRK